ncbi:MAG: rod shape-determining protein RodA [Dysgonamonadaceae bacterium]|jgi:rod shape determining protein RodA|nr:rod shape-determining protein RodA [Dysgonamonadaceae bacterium]
MLQRKTDAWRNVDWWTIALYLILVVSGWFSIYSSSYEYDSNIGMFDLSGRAGMQMLWIGASLVLAFVLMMLDRNSYSVLAYFIYAAVVLLLVATIFLAPDIKGSRSWLVFGPLRIQPAEFAKFAVALAIARRMSAYNFKLLNVSGFSTIVGLILLPMLLILLQKETGSALVYLAFLLVLYREGMSGSILFCGFCAVLFFIIELKYSELIWWNTAPAGEFIVLVLIPAIAAGFIVNYRKEKKGLNPVYYMLCVFAALTLVAVVVYNFQPFNPVYAVYAGLVLTTGYLLWMAVKMWSKVYLLVALFIVGSVGFTYSVDYVFNEILEPHQQVRIKVTLGMKDDPGGAGYNVNQSLIAIGSGGFSGKGFLNGTQTKLKYVPEQDTDFIFCTIGEEKGFLGSALVLVLFTVLIFRLIFRAERQKETFNRVYGYCVAAILFFHLAINTGMVIGLTPVIGIPLPFFSYGGSSLLGFTILLFIFLKLDAEKL